MGKILRHLRFRVVQSFRILNLDFRSALPVLLTMGLMIIIKLPSDYLYPVAFFVVAAAFHFNRRDVPFLKKVFTHGWQLIVVAESAIIYSILLLANINYKIESTGFIFLVLIFSFAFLHPFRNKNNFLSWSFIPDSLFEWRSFLRKNRLAFIAGYIIVTLSTYHPALLILVGILILDFFAYIFESNESKEMLESYFRTYTLGGKIRLNLKFFNILLLPIYIGFLIQNYENAAVLLYYAVFMNLYFLLVLTRKYRLYNHTERKNYYNSGVSLGYFLYTLTLVPAIYIIRQNAVLAKKKIYSYVGDQRP